MLSCAWLTRSWAGAASALDCTTRGGELRAYCGAVEHSFDAYGSSHWVVLILLAAGAVALGWFGSGYRGTPTVRTVGRVFAVVLVAFHVPILIYDLTPARF